jgi:hypothetical protein
MDLLTIIIMDNWIMWINLSSSKKVSRKKQKNKTAKGGKSSCSFVSSISILIHKQ